MFGRVQKGDTYTRFRLEFLLRNGVVIHETHIQANDQLARYPKLYTWTLDLLFDRLHSRVLERLQ